MRFATILEDGHLAVAVVRDGRVLPLTLPDAELRSIRGIAASGEDGLRRIGEWLEHQPDGAYRSIDDVELGPAVPDPGAIYTIGSNYATPTAAAGADARPPRPMVYGKLPTAVTGHGSVVTWDRSLTAEVDAESELGVVIGKPAIAVAPEDAMEHVFGYTCINDVSSRDPWLDGDQWLLGKSMAGFCPVGPWVVTRDEIAPGLHHQRRGHPGRRYRADALLDRRDHLVPQSTHGASARRPDRDRHAGPPGPTARAGATSPAHRHGDGLDRADRGAHDHHRLRGGKEDMP
jgi:hypothetical protein